MTFSIKCDDQRALASIGKAMLAQNQDCVHLIALDGTLQFMSEHGRLCLEIEPDAVPIGSRWSSLWPEETKQTVESAIASVLAGRIERFTALVPTARGTPKWWDVVVMPLRGDADTIEGILSILRDVTEQKAVEAALRESEQRFRGLADNMAQLAWMADSAGKVFWYNRRWFDYSGHKDEEMSDAGWRQVQHPDYVDRIAERMASTFERGEPWEEVLPLRAVDGTFGWFLTRSVPVRGDDGQLSLWCTTHTDITEHRNLSQRLRQLARVVEMSHEAILVWDVEKGIVLWNNGCEELYGFSRAEAVGQRSHQLLQTRHPVGSPAFEQQLRRDGEWSGELLHHAKGGAEVWVDSRQELIRAGGRDLVIETNRDITERRKSDELRELLVGELDHRVKNTLAIVQSIAAQTARTQPSIPLFMTRFAGRIQSLAAFQSMLSDSHWTGAEISELLRAQTALVWGESRHLDIVGDAILLPPDAALQIALIIHELASNAIRHGAMSSPTGKVGVHWLMEPGAKPRIVIEWHETGGPSVTATEYRGFGRRLIERAGQLPYLRTHFELPAEGARCRVWLDLPDVTEGPRAYFDPRNRVIGGRLSPVTSRAARTSGRRVVVIEDDPLEALWMEEVLADAGFLVIGPSLGAQGLLESLATLTFDLAIVDLASNAGDREKLLGVLESRGKPVLTLAAPKAEQSAGDQRKILPKPISAQSLVDAVKTLLRTP